MRDGGEEKAREEAGKDCANENEACKTREKVFCSCDEEYKSEIVNEAEEEEREMGYGRCGVGTSICLICTRHTVAKGIAQEPKVFTKAEVIMEIRKQTISIHQRKEPVASYTTLCRIKYNIGP